MESPLILATGQLREPANLRQTRHVNAPQVRSRSAGLGYMAPSAPAWRAGGSVARCHLLGGAARPVGIADQLGVYAGERRGGGRVAAELVCEPGGRVAEFAAGVPAVRWVIDRGMVGRLPVGFEDDAQRGRDGEGVVEDALDQRWSDDRVPDPVGGREEGRPGNLVDAGPIQPIRNGQ